VWQEVVLTMAQLGNPSHIKRLVMQMPTFGPNPIYLDNVRIETPNGSARTTSVSPEFPVEGRMTISPNPANAPVHVQILTDRPEVGTLSVVSLMGTVVASQAVQMETGLNDYTLDLSSLTIGTYLVQWQTPTKQLSQRLILVK